MVFGNFQENRRLEKKDQFQHREILQLKDRVHELMGKCERMSIKNKELEKKVISYYRG